LLLQQLADAHASNMACLTPRKATIPRTLKIIHSLLMGSAGVTRDLSSASMYIENVDAAPPPLRTELCHSSQARLY